MKIRLIPALLILLVIVVTVRLGFWQRDRAHQKEALEAQITQFENAPAQPVSAAPVELKDIEFHRVKARGSFVADKVVYLDNRPYNDQPGFYVVMPFKLADGGYVLVNRGWLPRNMSSRETIAPYTTPQGEIEIEGIARAECVARVRTGAGRLGRASADPPESRYRRVRGGNRPAAAIVRDPAIERRRRQAGARLARADAAASSATTATCSSGGAWRPRRWASACMPRAAPRRKSTRAALMKGTRPGRVVQCMRLAGPAKGKAGKPRNH